MAPKPNFKLFGLRYVREYIYGPYAQQIVSFPDRHIRYLQVVQDYKKRPRTGLWTSFATNTTAVKRVIRSYATRKLRVAWKEALEAKGYSENGIATDAKQPSLRGSVVFTNVSCLPVLHQPEVLKTDMKRAVQWIVSSQNGVGLARPSANSIAR